MARLDEGASTEDVANGIGDSSRTVRRWYARWNTEGTVARLPDSGSVRATGDEQDVALLQHIREHPFNSAVEAVASTGFPASVRTARRRLRPGGLRARHAAAMEKLSERNKECTFLQRPHAFWQRVIYIDEKVFQSYPEGPLQVYRPTNCRHNERYVAHRRRSGRFSVSVWGWMSGAGVGALHLIVGRLTGQQYRRILEDVLLPTARKRYPNGPLILLQVGYY